MPIYAYQCAECGHSHDALQKMSDAPLRDCPSCGKPALVKQVTAAGFQLKGSGWYVTDFRNNSSGPAKAPAAKPEASNEAPAAPATPSPAPQSETKTSASAAPASSV